MVIVTSTAGRLLVPSMFRLYVTTRNALDISMVVGQALHTMTIVCDATAKCSIGFKVTFKMESACWVIMHIVQVSLWLHHSRKMLVRLH
jgi:hypothetical protein